MKVLVLFFFTASVFSFASFPQPAGVEPLRSMDSAPKAIVEASKAVVRIRTVDGAAGTGFFLKQTEELVTNAHVVGHENCTREGCYVDIDLQLERDGEYSTKEVFVVPVLSSQISDITVMKVYSPEKGNPLAKPYVIPAGLEFSTGTGETAVDKELYIVGHPFAGLKRWSAAPVFRHTGDWCDTTHCTPSGNSGSPVLNPEGKIVGLVHRADDFGEKLTDFSHVEHSSTFTLAAAFEKMLADRKGAAETAAIKRFISIPLNGIKKISLDDDEDDVFDVTDETVIPLASRKLWNFTFSIEGQEDLDVNLVETLQDGCAMEIEDPTTSDDPDAAYSMCSFGLQLIDCTEESGEDETCPRGKKRKKWQKLFEDVADLLEIKNQPNFVGWRLATVTAFEPTTQKAAKAGRERLIEILNTHQIPVFETARYLAGMALSKEDMVYNGQDYLQLLTEYKKQKYYPQYSSVITDSIILLSDKKSAFLTPAELEPYYTALMEDPKLAVVLKMDLEASAYTEGLVKPISK